MVVNKLLLTKARDAGARLAEAEGRIQSARSEYHALVRRMHLAGASMREIARALDMSHQRVYQVVESAGGSWWRRIWRPRNVKQNFSHNVKDGLICTFCGRPENIVAKLIAGPGVYICDACVALADQRLSQIVSSVKGKPATPANKRTKTRCSFCRKPVTPDRPVFDAPAASICAPCLDVARQILADSSH
jgi:bacterioferritin-associated ferredoxin